MSEPPAAGEQRRDTRLSSQPPNQTPQRPWRTEALPSGHDDGQPPRRFRWIPLAILSTPESDRYGYDERYLCGRIIGALGGMAAEEEVFGVVTTGAEGDLELSTKIAKSMVGRWGMSERIGPISVLPQVGDPRMSGVSDEMLDTVDDEVRRISDECYAEARRLLRENRSKLDGIVEELLERETLDEPDIYTAAGIPRSTSVPVQA